MTGTIQWPTVLIEYRLSPRSNAVVLRLDHRILKDDGTPHDDRWWPVSDRHLADMQRDERGAALVARLFGREAATTGVPS